MTISGFQKVTLKYTSLIFRSATPVPMNDKNEPIKKETGGLKLPGGFTIGPMYSSKDGKTASGLIMQPAIIPFDFSVTNALNRLSKPTLPIDEFQTEFNSLVGNLIADILIYFQNRIKPIVQGGAGHFNDMGDCVRKYKKAGIEIEKMCDFDFLKDLSNIRGRKQHSDRRYDADYTINGASYETVEKLRELANKVKKEIHDFDDKLAVNHKDYDVKVTQTLNSVSIEFTALNHAFDLTRGGKVVPKKNNTPADKNSDSKGE